MSILDFGRCMDMLMSMHALFGFLMSTLIYIFHAKIIHVVLMSILDFGTYMSALILYTKIIVVVFMTMHTGFWYIYECAYEHTLFSWVSHEYAHIYRYTKIILVVFMRIYWILVHIYEGAYEDTLFGFLMSTLI
jgi:hypothetical protein